MVHISQTPGFLFTKRQVNEIAHTLAKAAIFLTSFFLFIDVPNCISTLIINETYQVCWSKKKKLKKVGFDWMLL